MICDQADYEWSKDIMQQHQLAHRCEVLFSPSYEQQNPGELADWILKDRLQVRLQIQLHKYLWGNAIGR